jgi:hypothetical protein
VLTFFKLPAIIVNFYRGFCTCCKAEFQFLLGFTVQSHVLIFSILVLIAYDLTNNENLDGVNVTLEFNGQILANELTTDGWATLPVLPDGETVTVTSILDGYTPNVQTILVGSNSYFLIRMARDVIF